jgi:hypothetical protein
MSKASENKVVAGLRPIAHIARFNPNNPLRIHVHKKSKSFKKSKKKMLKVKQAPNIDWL